MQSNAVTSVTDYAIVTLLRVVTDNKAKEGVFDIRSSAYGFDEICIKMFKIILPHILSCLNLILNHYYENCVFPILWKLARVLPFSKKSVIKSFNEQRLIRIHPIFSKIMEKLSKNSQLSEYIVNLVNIQNNSILSTIQSGSAQYNNSILKKWQMIYFEQ